ncbi:hypothetical protein RZA67_00330 [Stenotrophomonas sp. C3(2023)]|uniref:hypothetical protein n=1 Tax=Stenotrophomonas sp. C3(2023) TaxID=3080277 RepID=UPI00293CE49E|nr:hypothetical protein [Stenotrophomonas sp. C3(2023)]MDV3467183.1 hypothetical protein [Stenotrophomonas sp. C3(2023)]
MAADANVVVAPPDTPTFSPSPLDALEQVGIALRALAALLRPDDDLRAVERGDLAMLLTVLDARAEAPGSMASRARTAVVDLIGSGRRLECLTREDLHALVEVLALMQAQAVERLVAR